MLIADLKSLAGGLGISGAGSMKKAQLVEAIKAAQSSGKSSTESSEPAGTPAGATRTTTTTTTRQRTRSRAEQPAPEPVQEPAPQQGQPRRQPKDQQPKDQQPKDQQAKDQGRSREQQGRGQQENKQDKQQQSQQDKQDKQQENKQQQSQQDKQQNQGKQQNQNQQNQNQNQQDQGDDDGDGRGRSRRRRGRDRDRGRTTGGGGGGGGRNEPDTTVLEDDVLVPAAGILDVLDNYAFVRTSGYLPGADDVYVSLSMVRKFGLRRGDAVVGQVRQPREGERKEKFNPMVRIESVNGADPEAARTRVEFEKMTPLHPSERLRLEKGPDDLIGRTIDLVAPIGKGQRGLISSPAHAGKTAVLQAVAASLSANNPECHLMVVLVDERPEEVTDYERSVKGEVISSTFDRQPSDHTVVAELAIERAKRLVELGHDVVVLLDGITRLGRAYHLAGTGNGRVLSGGVDSTALHPPKQFFGAARNIENGGSLTVLATATVESGSKVDEVIFEELTGTANMELRLAREAAQQRVFPAVDVARSGTRHTELLLGEGELPVVQSLLDSLAGQGVVEAVRELRERLTSTQTNYEMLSAFQRSPRRAARG
nr:transcription termination factor Rho [Nocardioides marinisabuli]